MVRVRTASTEKKIENALPGCRKSASWQILTRKVNRFTATFTNFVKTVRRALNRGVKSTMMILVWMYSGIVPGNIEVSKMEEKEICYGWNS